MSEPASSPGGSLRSLGYSILILTRNAEAALPACLDSIRYCDDVVVLDAGSTDRTLEIARAAGARVFARAFDSFAGQRNWSQRNIPFRHPWVLHLDADERMSVEFWIECGGVVGRADVDGFLVSPKVRWNGRWVRRSSRFRQPRARLVRVPEFEFAEDGASDRAAGRMRLDELICCPWSDADAYGQSAAREHQHIRAEAEAECRLQTGRHLAQLRLRPLLVFLHRFVVCLGFLDGRAGLRYCVELARGESLTADNIRRRRRTART